MFVAEQVEDIFCVGVMLGLSVELIRASKNGPVELTKRPVELTTGRVELILRPSNLSERRRSYQETPGSSRALG